jgi:hypothetical protein
VTRPSNGTEGQAWMAAWCETCAKDVDDNCPIVLAGLVGNDPPEWHPGPLWSPQTVMYCTEYDPRARADAEEECCKGWNATACRGGLHKPADAEDNDHA